MSLKTIRKKIDGIDIELLNLLNDRLELALRTRKLKPAVRDTERENEVMARLKARTAGSSILSDEFVEKLIGGIIEESRRVQEKPLDLIGFQGEHGAFGEAAARRFRPNLVPIPCPQFSDVFEGVESGQLDFGIVPVENSLAGPVTLVNEMLVETKPQGHRGRPAPGQPLPAGPPGLEVRGPGEGLFPSPGPLPVPGFSGGSRPRGSPLLRYGGGGQDAGRRAAEEIGGDRRQPVCGSL